MENYFGDDGDGVAGTNVTRVADSGEEKAEMTANNHLRNLSAPPPPPPQTMMRLDFLV